MNYFLNHTGTMCVQSNWILIDRKLTFCKKIIAQSGPNPHGKSEIRRSKSEGNAPEPLCRDYAVGFQRKAAKKQSRKGEGGVLGQTRQLLVSHIGATASPK